MLRWSLFLLVIMFVLCCLSLRCCGARCRTLWLCTVLWLVRPQRRCGLRLCVCSLRVSSSLVFVERYCSNTCLILAVYALTTIVSSRRCRVLLYPFDFFFRATVCEFASVFSVVSY